MICFERNNKIKGGINMIKNFKRGSYKISKMAALGCLVCTVATLTNSIQVSALDLSSLSAIENSVVYSEKEKSQFLVESDNKHYADMNKVQKIAGFKYKIPDYIVDNYETESGGSVQKVSENENAVEIFFSNRDQNAKSWSYQLIISKCDPDDALKKIAETNNSGLSENLSINIEKENTSLKELNGQKVIVTVDCPEKTDGEYTFSAFKETIKYFVWNEDGVNYSINYNSKFESNGKTNTTTDISEDNIYDIVKSLKDIDKITNPYYGKEPKLSTETPIMQIYDGDDLQKAKSIIGFNPKFPVNIKDDIKIIQASINITYDSDIENNKLYYEMWSKYELNNGDFITLTSSNKNNEYEDIKEKGYYIIKDYDNEKNEFISLKVSAEKINLGNKVVYKSKEEDNNNITNIYFWEEEGVIYQLILWNNVDKSDNNLDSIAEVFINSEEYK